MGKRGERKKQKQKRRQRELAREIANHRLEKLRKEEYEKAIERGETPPKPEKTKKEKRRSAFLYIIILILLILGLAIMFYPSISDIITKKSQISVINKYDDKVLTMTDEELQKQWEQAVEYNKQADKQNYENILTLEGDVMAYVEIPKINVKLPVYHTTSTRSLQLGLGHIEGSSFPVGGINTHCLITGHTGIAQSEMFDDLIDIQKGDEFYIHVLNKRLAYKVVDVFIIEPEDTSRLAIERGKDLCSLITCYPYGINSHRLVVRGEHFDADDTTKQEIKKVEVPDSTQRTVVVPGGQNESVSEVSSQSVFLGPWGILLPSLLLIIITCILIIIRKMRKKKQKEKEDEPPEEPPNGQDDSETEEKQA